MNKPFFRREKCPGWEVRIFRKIQMSADIDFEWSLTSTGGALLVKQNETSRTSFFLQMVEMWNVLGASVGVVVDNILPYTWSKSF